MRSFFKQLNGIVGRYNQDLSGNKIVVVGPFPAGQTEMWQACYTGRDHSTRGVAVQGIDNEYALWRAVKMANGHAVCDSRLVMPVFQVMGVYGEHQIFTSSPSRVQALIERRLESLVGKRD